MKPPANQLGCDLKWCLPLKARENDYVALPRSIRIELGMSNESTIVSRVFAALRAGLGMRAPYDTTHE